jgi:hypothetical protein
VSNSENGKNMRSREGLILVAIPAPAGLTFFPAGRCLPYRVTLPLQGRRATLQGKKKKTKK